jgi:membrane protein DedA with SNARE-associated domain
LQANGAEYSAVAIFAGLFFGTLISEDAACLIGGTLAANGATSFAIAVTACFLGIFAGDVLLYGAGRLFGPRILDSRLAQRFIPERSFAKASNWLEKRGASAVFLSRFISGFRLPTYLLAGALRTNFAKFTLYFLLASAIWTPILVGSTAFAQNAFFSGNAIVGILVTFLLIRFSVRMTSWKRRRLFLGRVKRIAKWEFWPLWLFYAPVLAYVFVLGVRHRGLTLFTCVNPAIPAGGFKGESKSAIYGALARSGPAAPYMLSYTKLNSAHPLDERLRQAWRFVDKHQLTFPLVVKPDAGERGKDVTIVRSHSELADQIAGRAENTIIQEFAGGEEVSIFYYRFPNDQRGRIFSVTEKRFPHVTGDGTSSLEELILKDGRAVCLGEKYLAHNATHLETVPVKGETVPIIDIGTHSRGAVFLDGNWLKTRELEDRIDAICRGFDGFYFGRFDIRVARFDELKAGRNFKIVELNGVTSESTNIYDPRYTIFEAYRILFRQWRIAFEIGKANRDRAVEPTRIGKLIRLAFSGPKAAAARNVHHLSGSRPAPGISADTRR